jgi:hypothetical protein
VVDETAATPPSTTVGLHPHLGEMTAAAVVDRTILAHLEEHRAQLEGNLTAR